MPKPPDTDSSRKANECRDHDIAVLLLRNARTAAVINVVIAVLTYLAIPSVPRLGLWLILGASLLRIVPNLFNHRAEGLLRSHQALYGVVLLTVLLQGAAWGYASATLYQIVTDYYKFYLIAILCGMTGGAILSLTPSVLAYACFSLPSIVPITVFLLMEPEKSFNYAGFMGIIFLVGVMALARKISATHWDLITSRKELEETSAELVRHQKRLEQTVEERTKELEKSREIYRRLTEEINDIVYEVDGSGVIRYISPAITPALGYQPEDLLGLHFSQIILPEDQEGTRALFLQVITGDVSSLEFRAVNSEGQAHWMRTSSRPIMEDSGPVGFRGVLADIEKEKQAERERIELIKRVSETQKLEAMGTLAGGIAHDFNNLLMGIQGRATIIALNLHPEDRNREHLQAIEEHVRSASTLTSQLLGTARGGMYDPKPTDLNELVRRSTAMFGRTRKEIQLELSTSPEPAIADVDGPQIEQVLLNMFVNGWQAMPEGGVLEVRITCKTLDEAQCAPYKAKAGEFVQISVTDTGIGMDASVRERIFDPFFTTKAHGRGTGLGLASAHGIISNHNGFITVYSEKDKGSTFNIYLPRSKSTPRPKMQPQSAILKGSETILLVDDEELIIDVGQHMLESLGYTALVAQGGHAAVEQIKARGDTIQLVLLDMIMPGMDGGKTFDQIRQLYPTMPVILSSGYTISGQASEIMQRGCNGFIQKPFTMSELSQKIRSVLDTTE